jgi:hypothetical protein
MSQHFTYVITRARVWANGTGKWWSGEATIGIRADSSQGLNALRAAVRAQAEDWMRRQGQPPSGELELVEWGPKDPHR